MAKAIFCLSLIVLFIEGHQSREGSSDFFTQAKEEVEVLLMKQLKNKNKTKSLQCK
jgi:hypothetical protein